MTDVIKFPNFAEGVFSDPTKYPTDYDYFVAQAEGIRCESFLQDINWTFHDLYCVLNGFKDFMLQDSIPFITDAELVDEVDGDDQYAKPLNVVIGTPYGGSVLMVIDGDPDPDSDGNNTAQNYVWSTYRQSGLAIPSNLSDFNGQTTWDDDYLYFWDGSENKYIPLTWANIQAGSVSLQVWLNELEADLASAIAANASAIAANASAIAANASGIVGLGTLIDNISFSTTVNGYLRTTTLTDPNGAVTTIWVHTHATFVSFASPTNVIASNDASLFDLASFTVPQDGEYLLNLSSYVRTQAFTQSISQYDIGYVIDGGSFNRVYRYSGQPISQMLQPCVHLLKDASAGEVVTLRVVVESTTDYVIGDGQTYIRWMFMGD